MHGSIILVALLATLFLCIFTTAFGTATSVAGTTFGQPQPQQPFGQAVNLFGGTSQQSGLFGNTATSQAAPTLFGQQSQAPAAAPAFGMQQQRPLFSTASAPSFGVGFGAFSTNPTPSLFGQPQSSKPMGIATPNSYFPTTTASAPFGTAFTSLAPQQSLAFPSQQPGVLPQTQAPNQAQGLFGQPIRPFGGFLHNGRFD